MNFSSIECIFIERSVYFYWILKLIYMVNLINFYFIDPESASELSRHVIFSPRLAAFYTLIYTWILTFIITASQLRDVSSRAEPRVRSQLPPSISTFRWNFRHTSLWHCIETLKVYLNWTLNFRLQVDKTSYDQIFWLQNNGREACKCQTFNLRT